MLMFEELKMHIKNLEINSKNDLANKKNSKNLRIIGLIKTITIRKVLYKAF